MDYLLVCLVAMLASGLTLYSGFGLGTVLVPVFALFFPVPAAVAATASAFVGAWIGSRYLKKITLRQLQVLVALMLIAIGAGMAIGML